MFLIHDMYFFILTYFTSRLALPIANCAIGETVSHLAKGKQNSSPIWRNAFTTTLTRIVVEAAVNA